MKINILYDFRQGPWGGGNQFLKALREYFKRERVYLENPEDADVILFNSHHFFDDVFDIKKKYPDKILIHRVDGPVFLIRGKDKVIDKIIFQFNSLFADGTIFQSKWSRKECHKLGMKKLKYETVIMNAPDPTIFNTIEKKLFNKKKKKLIATSWSPNFIKGFDIYKYLDENLDFSKYEMIFIGNSPIGYKNIKWIRPVPSEEVAKILKEHDIYIIASRNDPCSNTLIEALHCGLPVVARNSGGHPEIIGGSGEFFNDEEDILIAIDKVANNYEYYQSQIDLPRIDNIGDRYYRFSENIYKDFLNGNYYPKKVNILSTAKFIDMKLKTTKWRIISRFQNLYRKCLNLIKGNIKCKKQMHI